MVITGCNNESTNDKSNSQIQNKQYISTFQKIKNEKILKVGYIHFPPAIIKTHKGLSGHFIDTIEEIASGLNIKIQYYETTWQTYQVGLKTNKYDICIAPTFITIPRAYEIAFTDNLFYYGNSAVARSNDERFKNIKNILELDKSNYTIAVVSGEASHEYVKKNFKQAKIKVLMSGNQSLAFTEVANERVDIALGDAWAVLQFVKHNDKLKNLFEKNPYNISPISWTTRLEDTQLLNFLNASLNVLKTTGQLREFEKRHKAKWLHIKTNWVTD